MKHTSIGFSLLLLSVKTIKGIKLTNFEDHKADRIMDKDKVIQEEVVVEYKAYKEKPYLNSSREPFGLTINGKTKEYLLAHETLKGLLKKGKQYIVEEGKMKILDVTTNKAMTNAIVEVSIEGGVKGNVEVKVHNKGKKGATIELRKMSDFEYTQVELLKSIISILLDGFIAGDDIDQIIKNSRRKPLHKVFGKVTSKPKLFSCDLCNWQTKFGSALKAHKKRIHNLDQDKSVVQNYTCDACDFQVDNGKALRDHILINHKQNNKRSLSVFKCEGLNCESTFDTEGQLREHEHNQHPKSDQKHSFASEKISPSSSPPRKKQVGLKSDCFDDTEVEMLDLEMEARAFVDTMLKNRISELENLVADMIEQKKKDQLAKSKLEKEIVELKSKHVSKVSKIPDHLSSVKESHLPDLRGYRMKFDANPNGACLDMCVAVHVYEDEEEGPKVKRRINNHVADNWENYYKHRIALPYIETVGVGSEARVIRKNSKEEMLDFLRSDESLMVYSNSQELLAISNLFNVNINIFTYRGDQTWWTEVRPDPEMAATAEVKFGKWVPDMSLYHSYETHYDLLIKDDSRIALVGLLAGLQQGETNQVYHADYQHCDNEADGWEEVIKKGRKSQKRMETELLLTEDSAPEYEKDDLDELHEEMTLLRSKNSGHRRTAPQTPSEIILDDKQIFKCDKCDLELESQGLLEAHDRNHHVQKERFSCDSCTKMFGNKCDLQNHIVVQHTEKETAQEWNCNDCSFQGNGPSELINHLKVTGHQPSQEIENRKSSFYDYKQCYTCKMEFDGYWNLMNHRKIVHPSNKKCRNFPENCKFGKECWYVHEEPRLTENAPSKKTFETQKVIIFKCNLCEETFKDKGNFMEHKKKHHSEKFVSGQCERPKEDCWFKKPENQDQSQAFHQQVFRKAQQNPFPPDQLTQMMNLVKNLCLKVENLEKKLNNLE